MTRKFFWDNPYLTELDTRVVSVQDDEVTLAETIFYAFSGAQESDSGTIGNKPVILARKDGPDIIYTLPANHTLNVGDVVKVAIDWDRRYRLMRLHFAAEIVLELASQNLPGIKKIGAHIAADKARIDFDWGLNISTAFPLLMDKANAIIAANHPIMSAFSDESQQRRYWEIEGFAHVPCGGTHLRNTGDVGQIALKRKNVGKAKERIEIVLLEAARPGLTTQS